MWGILLGVAKWIGGGLLGFLNTKVEADARVEITKTTAAATVAGGVLDNMAKADALNAAREAREGLWAPIRVMSYIILAFFTYHTGLVVLDSCPWLPTISTWYGIPYLEFIAHKKGSWSVAALPPPFDTTEHAVIQSLFIGASAAVTGLALIKAIRK